MIGKRRGIEAAAPFPRRLAAARPGPAEVEDAHAPRPAMAHQPVVHELIGPPPPRIRDPAAPEAPDPHLGIEGQHRGDSPLDTGGDRKSQTLISRHYFESTLTPLA